MSEYTSKSYISRKKSKRIVLMFAFDPEFLMTYSLQVIPVQIPVRPRRVRWQRLQRPGLRRLHTGASERPERHDRGRHRQWRGAAHKPRRHVHRRPRRAPRGLLPNLPHPIPNLQRRRLRPVRLPETVQRPVDTPQPAAPEQGDEPAGQVPWCQDHVRRLLQPCL